MEVSIIVIGDELLIGQVVDTNSGEIARAIAPAGWCVRRVMAVHDDAAEIRAAIDQALNLTPIVLTTGGLGPTKDDITKGVLTDYFGGHLVFDPEVMANVHRVFERRHLQMNKFTETQAMVPSSCRVIPNDVGTAPIMWFERDGRVLISMPGVPFEMCHAFKNYVFPQLLNVFGQHDVISHRTLVLTDITESDLAEQISDWENALPENLHLAYLPNPGYIRLRLDCIGCDADVVARQLDAAVDWLKTELAPKILADDDLLPAEILMRELTARGMTMATAESCTGGNIAHLMTMHPGVSEVFMGGIVSYANDVKTNLLGVDANDIERFGAVSECVVGQMALGACRATGANCAVATSGIAGPGGGSDQKPVGMVCFGVCVNGVVKTFTRHLPGNRQRVIDRASTTAIIELIKLLRSKSAH